MDRKGILGLIVVVALFGAWNFYYIRKSQDAALARQQVEAAAAVAEAANPKPDPTPAPVPSVPGAPVPNTPALEATV